MNYVNNKILSRKTHTHTQTSKCLSFLLVLDERFRIMSLGGYDKIRVSKGKGDTGVNCKFIAHNKI